ncbi:MAG: hypothetical protein ACRD0B_04255, partial [Acidimicrobiales bacterium]
DRIAWSAHTRNFRSQYGAQRGGVELTLIGSPEAEVSVATATLTGRVTLGDLDASPVVALGRSAAGELSLRRATGGLLSLGRKAASVELEDPVSEPSWYYARAILEDGEMAWSSPVWIAPT